eukprot:TRINITY_DN13042_c0_g1_i1.p1 TRINITY_DN13042_c0_g1~~TRINITY_DN13042_c0_g1_i1.p1  ORF type:complete len:450 (-),score=156.02 TRINITY_DN13042_c0_g1_i1:51-1223(-)
MLEHYMPAVSMMERAINENPNYFLEAPDAYKLLVAGYLNLGKYEHAMKVCLRWMDVSHFSIASQVVMACFHLVSAQLEDAQRILKMAENRSGQEDSDMKQMLLAQEMISALYDEMPESAGKEMEMCPRLLSQIIATLKTYLDQDQSHLTSVLQVLRGPYAGAEMLQSKEPSAVVDLFESGEELSHARAPLASAAEINLLASHYEEIAKINDSHFELALHYYQLAFDLRKSKSMSKETDKMKTTALLAKVVARAIESNSVERAKEMVVEWAATLEVHSLKTRQKQFTFRRQILQDLTAEIQRRKKARKQAKFFVMPRDLTKKEPKKTISDELNLEFLSINNMTIESNIIRTFHLLAQIEEHTGNTKRASEIRSHLAVSSKSTGVGADAQIH